MAPADCHSVSGADVASAYCRTLVGRADANAVVAGRATGATVGVGDGSSTVDAAAGGGVSVESPLEPVTIAMMIAAASSTTTPMITGMSQRGRPDEGAAGGSCSTTGAADAEPAAGVTGAGPAEGDGPGGTGVVGGTACQFVVGGGVGRSGPGRPVSLIGAPPCIASPEPSSDA